MHDSQITVVGNLAADPVHRQLDTGTKVTNFRIGSTPRRRTREGLWVDAETSWWEVSCFGFLAENTATSLTKGQRVLVTGRAVVEQWQVRAEEGGVDRSGTTARVRADAVGHDLAYGTSAFARVVRAVDLAAAPPEEVAASMGQRVDAHGELHPLEPAGSAGTATADPAPGAADPAPGTDPVPEPDAAPETGPVPGGGARAAGRRREPAVA